MSMPNNNIFDNLLVNKVKGHESEYSADAWEDMQMKLDNAKEPLFSSEFKKNIKILSLALLIIAVSFLTGYEFRNHINEHAGSDLPGSKLSRQKEAEFQYEKLSALNRIDASQQRNLSISARGEKANAAKLKSNFPGVKKAPAHYAKVDNSILLVKREDSDINNGPVGSQLILKPGLKKTDDDSLIASKDAQIPDKTAKAPVTNQLSKSGDVPIPKDAHKRTISFGPYLGFDWDMALYYQGAAASLDYTFGAFINCPLTDKLSLQSGLGCQVIYENIVKSDTVVVMNDHTGKVYQVTETGTNDIGYLHLPLILKYRLGRKFKVSFGPQVSYALSAPVFVGEANYKKDNTGHYQPVVPIDSSAPPIPGRQISNFNSDIYHFSIEMQLGIQWDISKSFDLSFIYFRQLTNVMKTENAYINTQGSIYNNTFQLRIGYKLFHKKFSED